MKKKRAIRNYVLVSIFIVLSLLLTFISFPVPGTNYNYLGIGNLHMGLELNSGIKNTYNLEVADWYEGNKMDAYNKTVERIQYLLDLNYSDAKVYLCSDNKLTIEVPDTSINKNYLVGLIEMKSESGKDAEAKVTGQDIASVKYMLSGTTHGVYIEFTEKGKEKFAKLTKEVASSDKQTMYIYMDKDYENAFSEPKVTEENSYGYTFISGSGITNKKTGEEYARKLESSLIGVNMSTELDPIEVKGTFGNATKIAIYVTTVVIVIACVIIGVILFRELGLVSMLSYIFALMVSVIISALCDMQVTFAGWIGFMLGFVFNYFLHMFYLNRVKKEYAMGKKFIVSFTSAYKPALFNILDVLLITTGTVLLTMIVPSNAIRIMALNFVITIPATAFTSLFLNKVLAVDYTAFNLRNKKKVNFVRGDEIDEVE